MMPLKAVEQWVVHCADPETSRNSPPRRSLSASSAQKLVDAAETHGVLPAVVRNFAPFEADSTYQDSIYQAVRKHAYERRRIAVAYATMLRGYSETLMSATKDTAVLLVKGRAFAEILYPEPFLRTFSDIDLLTAPGAVSSLASILFSHGFHPVLDPVPKPHETKWLLHDNTKVMVEVHTNLVHNQRMQRSISLGYQHLVGVPVVPASLVVAAVHGALDAFSRLRQVVDLCQAARKLKRGEEQELDKLLSRTGSRLAAAAGLELAFKMFAEPRCREIAVAIQTKGNKKLAAALLDPFVVTALTRPTRFLHSWRRQWYRMLLAGNSTEFQRDSK
jgi:hypothetical protein